MCDRALWPKAGVLAVWPFIEKVCQPPGHVGRDSVFLTFKFKICIECNF